MATVTGVAGSVVNAVCTVTDDGPAGFITEGESAATAQSLVNDLATLDAIKFDKSGGTISGPVVVNGAETMNGIETFNADPVLGAGSALTITNATNATPIVVTTSAAHGFSDGDQVIVASVGGNTAANGGGIPQLIDVLTSTTFALVGSVGNGAYTSGGTATHRNQVVYSASRAIVRNLSCFWFANGSGITNAGWYATPSVGSFTCFDPAFNAQFFGAEIDAGSVPQGSILTAAVVYLQPNGGHAAFPGGAPATFPSVKIYRFVLATAVTTAIATQADTNTGSAGAYEAYHTITATIGSSEIVDHIRNRYYVVLSTETGANAIDGTRAFGAAVALSTRGVQV